MTGRRNQTATRRKTSTPHPEVMVLSEHMARLHEPEGREVCISVTDPGKPTALLSDRFVDILRLAFTDIDQPPDSPPWFVLFSPDQAREVARFIEKWNDVDRIVIHCRAGLSRSPGIALGLCDLFSWPLGEMEREHPLCNRWVRNQIASVERVSHQRK